MGTQGFTKSTPARGGGKAKGFFKRAWEGIKNFGRKILGGAKTGLNKANDILKTASEKSDEIKETIHTATDVANNIANLIPNEKAKEKIQNITGKINDATDYAHTKTNQIIDKGKDYVNTGKNIANVIDTATGQNKQKEKM